MLPTRVTAGGYTPTAHPVTAPRLTMRGEDELMQRRLGRGAMRRAEHQAPSTGTAARMPKRAAMVA
jgi:hypothetical protein